MTNQQHCIEDRLARSTRDLLNILHDLGDRGVGFKSLADAWADTTTVAIVALLDQLRMIAQRRARDPHE